MLGTTNDPKSSIKYHSSTVNSGLDIFLWRIIQEIINNIQPIIPQPIIFTTLSLSFYSLLMKLDYKLEFHKIMNLVSKGVKGDRIIFVLSRSQHRINSEMKEKWEREGDNKRKEEIMLSSQRSGTS